MKRRSISEVDVREAWAEIIGPQEPVIPGAGRTVAELAREWGCSPATASRKMAAALAAGKVRKIGVRPGPCRAAVYEVSRPTRGGQQ